MSAGRSVTDRAAGVPSLFLLNNVSLVLFGGVLLVFSILAPRFLTGENLLNILVQSSATVLVATGMTFVLITAGVDLSVGAAMFVGAALCGKAVLSGYPPLVALLLLLVTGAIFGAFNALFVTRLGVAAFVVTLATLFMGRGLALRITETRAMNLPEVFLQLGAAKLLGIPMPLWLGAAVVTLAQLVLSTTPFGRQLYAVGQEREAARKAGIRATRLIASVYMISGLCAALGGIVALTQLGAVGPRFGENYEFKAIAAAVLGGTSLFGGRGRVFPGTVLGAVLIQSVENGLVLINADPYLYPLVTSAVIFAAVLVDVIRSRALERMTKRRIRPD